MTQVFSIWYQLDKGNEDEPNGLCAEYEKIIKKSGLNPDKLKRHLESHHPYLRNKKI